MPEEDACDIEPAMLMKPLARGSCRACADVGVMDRTVPLGSDLAGALGTLTAKVTQCSENKNMSYCRNLVGAREYTKHLQER